MIEAFFVLSHFHSKLGPIVFLSHPENTPKVLTPIIKYLLDFSVLNVVFDLIHESYILTNLIFDIPSPWTRGLKERIMLTCITKQLTQVKNIKEILISLSNEIKNTENIYKAFYNKDNDISDTQIGNNFKNLSALVTKTYNLITSQLESQPLGKILTLGQFKAGKSSIINRLSTGVYNENIRPTIGSQILRTMVEQLQFEVRDVGGQEKLRYLWFEKGLNPDAIIFVIDLNQFMADQEIIKNTLTDVITHYQPAKNSIPFLILGNKIDIIPLEQRSKIYHKIKNLLKTMEINLTYPYHIGFVSAKTNEGILLHFRWLAAQCILHHNISEEKLTDTDKQKLEEIKSNSYSKNKILDLWIYNDGGIELFSYTPFVNFEPTLLGGFLIALTAFGQEFAKNNLTYFVFGEMRFTIFKKLELPVYILTRTHKEMPENSIIEILQKIYSDFTTTYSEILNKFNGNVNIYSDFIQKLRDLI